jgi:hypothetical protein
VDKRTKRYLTIKINQSIPLLPPTKEKRPYQNCREFFPILLSRILKEKWELDLICTRTLQSHTTNTSVSLLFFRISMVCFPISHSFIPLFQFQLSLSLSLSLTILLFFSLQHRHRQCYFRRPTASRSHRLPQTSPSSPATAISSQSPKEWSWRWSFIYVPPRLHSKEKVKINFYALCNYRPLFLLLLFIQRW